jgi:dolichyl-phosphate-mannose--protein O-mannosyl transferase
MRLNPEHPPLIKDIAALPLVFQNLSFPEDDPSWTENINDQWVFGPKLIFNPENNPDRIMLTARTMMLLFLALLGILIFKWARERYGNKMALLALFFFVFSPTFLAHGRYVTTDVGAAFGFVLALYFLLKFLEHPNKRNIIVAGIGLGVALLLKFSLFLLIPFFGGLVVLWFIVHALANGRRPPANFWRYAGMCVLILVIAYIVVWPVYLYHTVGYPADRQVRDTADILRSSPYKAPASLAVWMADKHVFRPYAQYALGLLMVFQRSAGGNTAYFLGDVSSNAWPHYFPVVYLVK